MATIPARPREGWIVAVTVLVIGLYGVVGLWNSAIALYLLIAAIGTPLLLAGIRHPEWVLYVFAAILPFDGVWNLPVVGSVNTAMGAVLLLCTVVGRNISLRRTAVSPAGWIWCAWALTSLTWAKDFQLGYVTDAIGSLLTVWMVANLAGADEKVMRGLVRALAVGAILGAGVGALSFVGGSAAGISRIAAGDAQSVAQYGLGMLPGAMALMAMALQGEGKGVRQALLWAAFGFAFSAIILSGTRSAWLGFILATFLVFRLFPDFRSRVTYGLLLFILLLVFLQVSGIAPVLEAIVTMIDKRLEAAERREGRDLIWRVSFGMFSRQPILGVGYHNHAFAMDYTAVANSPFPIYGWVSNNTLAHNMYLQNATEMGIVGLGIFCTWLGGLLRRAFPSRQDLTRLTIYAILVAFVICGFFSNVLYRKYFWLVIGMAEASRWSLARKPRSPEPPSE